MLLLNSHYTRFTTGLSPLICTLDSICQNQVVISFLFQLLAELTQFKLLKLRADVPILPDESAIKGSVSLKATCLMAQDLLGFMV